MSYEFILAEKRETIGIITINRPKSLNAICEGLVKELAAQLNEYETDNDIGAIVITGNEKAFAAGFDIAEIANKSFADIYLENYMGNDWEKISRCRKPIIAAVAGYAFGCGCELAMMCDFIIAADNAKFGQPEITMGLIPSLGGTQRLTKLIGKPKAMEMILTGRSIDADEAEKAGLVSRVVPLSELMNDAIKTAEKIASMSHPITVMAKESINKAYETHLAEGLSFEKTLFYSSFGTEDHFEGMSAFIEKRQPVFGNK